MHARRAPIAALVLSLSIVALAGAPAPVPAADNGLAWDAVVKLLVNADAASLQPGSFDADYVAASAPAPSGGGGGGMFAKYKQAMAAAQQFGRLMKTGLAERHYVAGSKERIDHVAENSATITDCAARTITTLDLGAKTYRVESMDSESGSSGGDNAGPGGKNDVRVAISVQNTALGALTVGGVPTNGYRSNMTFTETNASGQSETQNGDVLGYYSTFAEPAASCARARIGPQVQGPGMDVMAGYGRVLRALSTTNDPHFSIKQSGPPLPIGKLTMYTALTFAMQGHNATFLTERGNVRPISAGDPIFSVPSGFTRQQ